MTNTITIDDPELAKMLEETGAPSAPVTFPGSSVFAGISDRRGSGSGHLL